MPLLVFIDKIRDVEDTSIDLSDRDTFESEIEDSPKLLELLKKYEYAEALEKFAASLHPADFTVELRWAEGESKEAPEWLKEVVEGAKA